MLSQTNSKALFEHRHQIYGTFETGYVSVGRKRKTVNNALMLFKLAEDKDSVVYVDFTPKFSGPFAYISTAAGRFIYDEVSKSFVTDDPEFKADAMNPIEYNELISSLVAAQYVAEFVEVKDYYKDKDVLNFCDAIYRKLMADDRKFEIDYNPVAFGRASSEVDFDKTETSEVTAFGDIIEDFKSGKYAFNWLKWTAEDEKDIQPVSMIDDVVFNGRIIEEIILTYNAAKEIWERKDEADIRKVWGEDANEMIKIWFGDPGSGKTTIAYAMSAIYRVPIYMQTYSRDTEETVLTGKPVLKDGNFDRRETALAEAIRKGKIVINEEANLCDSNRLFSMFGPLTEFPYVIKEFEEQNVQRHPSNILIFTMNKMTSGAKPLHEALINRSMVDRIEAPTVDEFIERLMSGGASKDACTWVYGVYERCMKYLKSDEICKEYLCKNISLRTCKKVLYKMQKGIPAKTAAKLFATTISVSADDETESGLMHVIDGMPAFRGTI